MPRSLQGCVFPGEWNQAPPSSHRSLACWATHAGQGACPPPPCSRSCGPHYWSLLAFLSIQTVLPWQRVELSYRPHEGGLPWAPSGPSWSLSCIVNYLFVYLHQFSQQIALSFLEGSRCFVRTISPSGCLVVADTQM